MNKKLEKVKSRIAREGILVNTTIDENIKHITIWLDKFKTIFNNPRTTYGKYYALQDTFTELELWLDCLKMSVSSAAEIKEILYWIEKIGEEKEED